MGTEGEGVQAQDRREKNRPNVDDVSTLYFIFARTRTHTFPYVRVAQSFRVPYHKFMRPLRRRVRGRTPTAHSTRIRHRHIQPVVSCERQNR